MNRVVAAGLVLLSSAFAAAAVRAAPVPVEVDVASLRAIQTYELEEATDDKAYLVVTGVAKGEEVQKRLPEQGAFAANKKKPPVTEKAPATLWKGELADGEFALLSVVLIHQGQDASKTQPFLDQLSGAAKKVAERSKKTLTDADADKLVTATLAGQREAAAKARETLTRANKADHFGGLFNVLVWNNGGKLAKRVDPIGLTFGEHYGNEVKAYSKIKFTRPNVFEEEDGEWFPVQLEALNDDKTAVRVKMLETEYVKSGEDLTRNVTDYLAEVVVKAAGAPQKWDLGGEHAGPTPLHTYWDFAR
jgi:hypothetical protein